MPMAAHEIDAAIRDALPGADVALTDLAGDGDHWAAVVTAPQFQGLSRVRQHQLVYNALGGRMGGVLHALKLTTIPA
ncbi:ATP-binding protein [Polymorphobacter multimanifer]|nr:BolA/IbaG family iron-sulfur metabolism protein [Polymorphobacter multimanifer]GGI69212.1 ATP-binding protein [Polymorphobacter multimanifer]